MTMKKLKLVVPLLALLLSMSATQGQANSSTPHISVGTFSSMPVCDALHDRWVYFVEDASATGDCTAGGGTETYAICTCSAAFATWEPSGDGGSGGGLTLNASTLAGRGSASGSGSPVEISLGGGLVMSGTTLNTTGTSTGPRGSKYDPDRLTASIYFDEECTGSLSGSWSWANQGSATDTIQLDTCDMYTPTTGSGGSQYRTRWVGLPSASDWVTTTRLHLESDTGGPHGGVLILAGGTKASPTLLIRMMYYNNGTQIKFHWGSITSYAEAGVTTWNDITITTNYMDVTPLGCFQVRYNHTSKVISGYYAADCLSWMLAGTPQTLGADPTDIGRFISSSSASIDGRIRFYWFRIRNDATGLADPYPAGGS